MKIEVRNGTSKGTEIFNQVVPTRIAVTSALGYQAWLQDAISPEELARIRAHLQAERASAAGRSRRWSRTLSSALPN